MIAFSLIKIKKTVVFIILEFHKNHTFKQVTVYRNYERGIFQTFWRPNSCTNSLFLKLQTSNIGYLLIMAFPVVEFSKQGYKIRKVFGKKSTVFK